MEEVWKDIYYFDYLHKVFVDYRGIYQVSNFGRVRSLDRDIWNGHGYRKECGKIMSQHSEHHGYQSVGIGLNNKQKRFKVHRLVAGVFIPNPLGLTEVNHKNEISNDNRVENLEWCDRQYNNTYGNVVSNRIKSNLNNSKSKPVIQMTMSEEILATYPSIMEAKRQTGLANINACLVGKRNSAGGFKWRYAS